MLKKLMMAVLVLAVIAGTSWGTTVSPDYTISQDLLNSNNNYANYLYDFYGNEINFNYQLRELVGTNTAGPQWFATVYENYYNHVLNRNTTPVYRRTTGGEIPEVSISAIGNLIGGFKFVTVEESQDYYNPTAASIYDRYPDPLESVCLVIKNGTGDFNVKFANPYASHFPYWWHWATNPNSPLWNNRANIASVNEPIAFMINTSSRVIAERGTNGNYTDKYSYAIITESNDEGTITGYHYEIKDLAGNLAYKTSGDSVVDRSNNTLYTVSGDFDISGMNIYGIGRTTPDVTDARIYDVDGKLAYTLEEETINNVKYVYVCDVRSVTESVRIEGFEDYTFTIVPNNEQTVNPGEYYSANVNMRSTYGNDYDNNKLGYITFRQSANLATGYSGYRENSPIPLVVANVYDGTAADVPLQFDMTVYSSATDKTADNVISRVKFEWDVQENKPDQDLGTFFMIRPSGQAMPTYYLETQITNKTATRYRLYHMLGNTMEYYEEISPKHWKYNLPFSPEVLRERRLPPYFHLDPHSQIAPGLVTVYDHEVYGTVDTAYDTYESFQIHDYENSVPRSLRLNYKRVGGMYLIKDTELGGVRTREFSMQFADVIQNDDETAYELENLMGKPHSMVNASVNNTFSAAAATKNTTTTESQVSSVYINSSAINAFRFLKDVPGDLVHPKTVSDDTASQDKTDPDSSDKTLTQLNEQKNFTRGFSAAEDTQIVSLDIPLQPLSIRMRIPRNNQLIIDHWTEFENATSSRALFEAFARYGTVWLRSNYTGEKDLNLFTAIDDANGASAVDCVRAFLYKDELFLDFIIILADAKSPKSGGGAYLRIFHDDGIPYVLIGDGSENGKWDMTFYVSATGANPTTRDDTNAQTPETNNQTSNQSSESGGGGGGGCNFGLTGIFGALMLIALLRKNRA